MYPRNAIPLIIVGRQRAGTRFLTDLLNSFDGVCIQAELPNPVMRAAAQMVRSVDTHYAKMAEASARHRKQHNRWLRKKEELIFAIWANASQGVRVKYNANTRYFGYKRPNNEFYFDFYETSFRSRPPFYVYCTRNFTDNYLSIVSRWPERTIEQTASDYTKSTEQYHRMVAGASGRVLLFNLDDHIEHGLGYIEENIVSPLGLHLECDHRRKLEHMRAKNRTEQDLRIPRRKSLTEEEQDFIDGHPELEKEFSRLCSGRELV